MKVIYIFLDSTKSPGVLKKVKSKIKLLNADGIEAEGIFLNKNISARAFNPDERITYVPLHIKELPFFYNRRFIRNYKSHFAYNNIYRQLYAALDKELSGKEFDLLLFRYPLANKYLLRFCNKYRNKIVFEHNSKELVELSLGNNGTTSLAYLNEQKYGAHVLSRARAITGVGNEITTYEKERSGNTRIPACVIANAIEVASMPLRHLPEFDGTTYNLLYVTGSPSPWVGIDIVLKSLGAYKTQIKFIKLYIVGPKSAELTTLAESLHLKDKVFFEGEKHGAELDAYFNTCHVAFGTMAMQRVGLNEHSSLKILEYSSRGMPFVVGYNDTNFYLNKEVKPYVLTIPYTGHIFNFEEVLAFADQISRMPEHPLRMRKFAEENLDTSVKMKSLRTFLKSL